ncbi:terpene synthase family protein [Nonomuraea insulae]|uniref:Terpene synthase n=1 Tax=Nonomuraea insulae TaxID=1616787 RepID=A0ABW1D218_9ACTN
MPPAPSPPFEFPTPYQPDPARLSPHADATHEHSMAWSREMGLFDFRDRWGERIWDEAGFASMRIPLMAAYCHPDAARTTLELVSDWYVWTFWFDDHFARVFKRPGAREQAKEHLARLRLFTPVDFVDTPPPANPAERGLADLWSRTFAGASPGWRRRFAASTQGLIQDRLRELENMRDQRVPNPIEYIGLRRSCGGAPWSAGLVEYTSAAEVPDRIAGTRAVRVLRDTFSDGAHLLDDLYSYRQRGELDNGVLALRTFLGCGAQEAADRVNDLRTSRLRQFENIALTELPPVVEECGLDPEERGRVARYVQGLRDWQSGTCEWHRRSSRYPAVPPKTSAAGRARSGPAGELAAASGLAGSGSAGDGVSAGELPHRTEMPSMAADAPGRISPVDAPGRNGAAVDRTPGYLFRLPEFEMPWAVRMNPHHAAAQAAGKAWACEMGIVGSSPDALWSDDRYDAMRFAEWCAMTSPEAAPECLELMALWFTWILALDDHFIVEYQARGDIVGAQVFLERLAGFMPLEAEEGPPPQPGNGVERGLDDLWGATIGRLAGEGRAALRREVLLCAEGNLWEMGNSAQHRVPDPIDYVEMSRVAKGVAGLGARLVPMVQELDISEEVLKSRFMRELVNAYADHIDLTNDIISYRLETEVERHLNNGVLAVRNFLRCDLQQAVEIVNDQLTACVRKFERIANEDLPGVAPGSDVAAYVESLRHWMCGNLAWHVGNSRYIDLCPVGGVRLPKVLRAGHVSAAPAPSDQGMQRLA